MMQHLNAKHAQTVCWKRESSLRLFKARVRTNDKKLHSLNTLDLRSGIQSGKKETHRKPLQKCQKANDTKKPHQRNWPHFQVLSEMPDSKCPLVHFLKTTCLVAVQQHHPKAVPLSQCLAQCLKWAEHSNTKKTRWACNTHGLEHTHDCPSHTRGMDACGWNQLLLMTTPWHSLPTIQSSNPTLSSLFQPSLNTPWLEATVWQSPLLSSETAWLPHLNWFTARSSHIGLWMKFWLLTIF